MRIAPTTLDCLLHDRRRQLLLGKHLKGWETFTKQKRSEPSAYIEKKEKHQKMVHTTQQQLWSSDSDWETRVPER